MPQNHFSIFTFRFKYLLWVIVLFIVEVLIALFVDDSIIRPHVGDVLVVILIYCFLRAFFRISVVTAAVVSLLFSYLVELLQYFNYVDVLGMQNSRLARVVMGTSFSWIDIFCYTLGIVIVVGAEMLLKKKSLNKTN